MKAQICGGKEAEFIIVGEAVEGIGILPEGGVGRVPIDQGSEIICPVKFLVVENVIVSAPLQISCRPREEAVGFSLGK